MVNSTEKKELWFIPDLGNRLTKGEKVKLLIWRCVDALFYQTTLTVFSRWRVFLLRLFGAKIGKGCYISPKSRVYLPWNLEIGNYSSIDDYVCLRSVGKIVIGDFVSIGMGAHIIPGGHDIRSRGFEGDATFCKIGNGVFLGADSFVGRGVTIGQFSVLGSRAAAYKDIPENSVAVGIPAKVIGERIPNDEYVKYRYSMD